MSLFQKTSPCKTSPRWGEELETAFAKTLIAFLICDRVTLVPPAALWRPGDRQCQTPR
jgi:hypothetical protein